MDPQSETNENSTPAKEQVTASRWKRLGASLVDSLIMIAILTPVMFLTGGFDNIADGVQPSFTYNFLMGIFGVLIFVLINGSMLAKRGQTVGKRLLEIKIVTLSGDLPDVKEHLLKRYAVYFLPGQIPRIGQLLSLLNILLIFGQEKRCGHDYIAGTKVVEM